VEGSLQARLARGRNSHLRGDFDDAARLYESILEENPNHAEACYRFGNLLKDQGDLARALEMYHRAVELRSDYAHAYCNRAVVLGLLDQPAEALKSYDRAIEIDPSDSIALCNRAMLLAGLGQKDAALTSFEAALKHDPKSFAAHFGRGAILQQDNQWADSLTSYQCAIAVNPSDAAAHYNLAVVAKELHRWDEALTACELAIKLNPRFSHAYAKCAEIMQELKQYPAALAGLERAVELDPGNSAHLVNRGVVQQLMEQYKGALADYDQAISLNPANPEAWFNLGTVLKQMDDPHGALDSYERAIALKPAYEAAYLNRGTALQDLGLVREALASYQRAITLNPDLAEAHYNLALASLTLGDYAKGWYEHEWRWRAKNGSIYREKRDFAQPLWLGQESIAGKTILLYAEQGLGDCLEFCRYVEMVAKLGPRIIFEVPRPLVRLLASLPGVEQIVAFGDPLPHFDVQCPLMSLPLAFRTTLATVPSPDGYIQNDADRLSAWRQRLGPKIKPRIGLTWSGASPKRSFELSRLIPYLPDAFDYFCLQANVAASDQEALETSEIFQFEGLIKDFTDNSALCACMDLVVSVDTSVAHLACSTSKTTWIMLAYVADWRWLTEREDSPWYSSVRLFRQQSEGDWEGVFERVAAELRVRQFAAD
jgi:tetratricopeptide (TPR) repeat protein